MKKTLVIFFLLLCCVSFASAQSPAQSDTARVKKRVDRPQHISDSLKLRAGELQSSKSKVESKYDSVTNQLNKPQDEVSRYRGKIDSLQNRLTFKIDSLTALPSPNKLLIGSLDSLRGQLDSLKQTGLGKGVQGGVDKVKSAQSKIASIEGKVNQKLNLFNINGGNAGNLNLPSAPSFNANSLANLNAELKLPDNPLGNVPELKGNLPEVELGELGGVKDISQLPKEKLGELAQIDGVKEVKNMVGDASEISGQVKGYSGDIKSLAEGDIGGLDQTGKALEGKLTGLDDVKSIQEDVAPVTDYTELLKKWNSDPAVAKEMALNKAKEEAVNHFAGHESELKTAMEQMSKLKAKRQDAEAVVDLFKKPENPMKGKRFVERLLPGISLQIQSSSNTWLDFHPQVGYRWTGRWTTGIGWTERLAVNFKKWNFVRTEHAYGPRGFAEFKFKENLHLRADADYLNALVTSPVLLNRVEFGSRAWVWSYFAGVKKSFNFSKSVRGNVQLMYNIYNPEKRSPYMSRLNIRMGFEFPYRKREVKTESK